MPNRYRRPAGRCRAEIVIDNSRFITTIERADKVSSARDFISEVRQEMPDASHHVYAFCIGYGNSTTEGMSDDGEPSGTAGPPTLTVLRNSEIGDVVLVTTRYFGGKKLGTGGLVRAYTQAAQEALKQTKTELKTPRIRYRVQVGYSYYEKTNHTLQQNNHYEILEEEFAAEITLIVDVQQVAKDEFEQTILNLTGGQVEIEVIKSLDF